MIVILSSIIIGLWFGWEYYQYMVMENFIWAHFIIGGIFSLICGMLGYVLGKKISENITVSVCEWRILSVQKICKPDNVQWDTVLVTFSLADSKTGEQTMETGFGMSILLNLVSEKFDIKIIEDHDSSNSRIELFVWGPKYSWQIYFCSKVEPRYQYLIFAPVGPVREVSKPSHYGQRLN